MRMTRKTRTPMDFDDWIRLANTVANYATTFLLIMLVSRLPRNRRGGQS